MTMCYDTNVKYGERKKGLILILGQNGTESMSLCVSDSYDLWCVCYLLDTAQLVHGALIVLHAVFRQLQVSRVLQGHERLKR